MRRISIFFFCFILSTTLVSQRNSPQQILTKQEYLQKSKEQKKTILILKAVGAPLFIGGIVWGVNNWDNEVAWVLATAGAACILATIPFTLASENNKRRAMSMSFEWRQSPQLQHNDLFSKLSLSLTLRAHL